MTRIDQLVGEGAIEQAATLCAEAGDHKRASDLLEQACDFAAAAREAELAGELGRSMRLAVLAGVPAAIDRARDALLASEDLELVARCAADLADRQHLSHAGHLFRAAGRLRDAASLFERAGDALEAAACHEELGSPAEAARLLEALLRAPQHGADVDRVRLDLGSLYARHGKHQPAVRMLQRLTVGSRWRRAALPDLARSLAALGLDQALRDLRPELDTAGLDEVGSDAAADAAASAAASPPVRGEHNASGVVLFGRYRVLREVATTPHARVSEAVDQISGKRVAVKLFASRVAGVGRDALQRFVREARALAKLRHPNVVPLIEYVPQGPALVMQWMAGGSLAELLLRETLSPARAAEIAMALLAALAEAHRLGILHRDVKPSNLLFDDAGTARLADFGAAHLDTSGATVTAADIGTLAYMAPEQRLGLPATVQSDVYAVGMLMLEMLGGRATSQGPVAADAQALHPDLGATHDALLAQLLADAPEQRAASALAARDAVGALRWPTRVVARKRHAATEPEPSLATERFGRARSSAAVPPGCQVHHDGWLGRDVWHMPMNEPRLVLAGACARADHPALPLVLRADRVSGSLWFEAPVGQSLAHRGRGLTAPERSELAVALDALHAAGAAHGSIDAAHVYFSVLGPVLAFPAEPELDARDADRAALGRL